MPKCKIKQPGLLDTWGRRNRKHADRICEACGKSYRPLRKSSRFCSHPCMWSKNGGWNKKPESWWKNSKGYIIGKIWLDDETQVHVKKHRYIMQGILGRPLKPNEDVHHKDGNKSNNSPDNLELITHGKHATQSNINRVHRKGYKLNISKSERKARSIRAIQMGLGHSAISKATT